MAKFMAHLIYGRRLGSGDDMTVLMEGKGVSTGGVEIDPSELVEFALASVRRAVQVLRDKRVEGYVQFEGDPTRYEFTPALDFVYPTTVH